MVPTALTKSGSLEFGAKAISQKKWVGKIRPT
jgi:hypothetical protein